MRTYSSKTSPPHPSRLITTIIGVQMSGTTTIRAKRVTNTVSVSPVEFGLVLGVGAGCRDGDDEEEMGDGHTCPLIRPVRDRDRDTRPFSACSISVSTCVANSPGSTSPAVPSRRLDRGCIRAINTSPIAPIMDESDVVDESREGETRWRGAPCFSARFPLFLAFPWPSLPLASSLARVCGFFDVASPSQNHPPRTSRVTGTLHAPALSKAPLKGIISSDLSNRWTGGTSTQNKAKRDATRGGERDVSVLRSRMKREGRAGWSHRGAGSDEDGRGAGV